MRRVCVALLALALVGAAPRKSMVIAAAGPAVVTINPDSDSISVIDAFTLAKRREIAVCTTPQSLSVDDDAARAFVVCRDGTLAEVDLNAGRVLRRVAAGYDPFGVVAAADRVFVSVTGEHRVAVYDRATLQPVSNIPTDEFPRGLALDGTTLYVTHFRSGKLSVIDTATKQVTVVAPSIADAELSQSVVIGGGQAWLPQTRANSASQTLAFNVTLFPILSAVDLTTRKDVSNARFAIELFDAPTAIPIDAAITSKGKMVMIDAGSDDAIVIDSENRTLLAHLATGNNPRGVALSPDQATAYVNNTLSGTVTVIDLLEYKVTATAKATTIPLPPDVLNGKILFNSSSRSDLARERWIACASCHWDGGTDGRTWFFRDGPRSTPPLFGVGDTLPMHWSGDLDELQDVESTIRIIQAGTGLTASRDGNCTPACNLAAPNSGQSRDLDDLAAFMRSLQPPPRSGTMSPAAARGQTLFNDARTGCASCHAPPLYTDRLKHDVGTGGDFDRKGPAFDTPSLRGLADSAPYLHDGSAAALIDVVRRATGLHGDTRVLTESEKSDLAAFLREIGLAPPAPPAKRRAARP